MLSPYQQKKLQDLKEKSDPTIVRVSRILHERAMAKAAGKLDITKGETGKDGYTPIKGKDYFTQGEIDQVLQYIKSQVVKNGKDGINGKSIKGDSGKDGKNGINGTTPLRGVHYWTKQDVENIKKEVLSSIPKQEIIEPKPISYKEIKDAPDLKTIEDLIKFLKMGGFRGGGTSTASTGGGFTTLTATEIPSSITPVYIFTFPAAIAQPSFIISDNVWQRAITKSGTVNWTWNTGTKQATFIVPPQDEVLGIV